MKATAEPEFRRKGRESAPAVPWSERWYGRLALLSLSVALLTLSYAPIKQFYLAWFGLVPWLIVIARCRSYKSAVFWGWFSGTMFFIANMWWMAYVTAAGMVGLMAVLAGYWGLMGAAVRAFRFGVRDSSPSDSNGKDDALKLADRYGSCCSTGGVFLIAFAWTALEFIRGNFIWKGLPWLYLGHTQTPILVVCQIADTLGVYGISFWIVLLNAIIAAWWLGGFKYAAVRRAVPIAAGLTLFIILYGVWRMVQTVEEPGPVVMVVQSNDPQSNTGEKGASLEDRVLFYYQATKAELIRQKGRVDLVVWSETTMPELNLESRQVLRGYTYGQNLEVITKLIEDMSATFQVGFIVGGHYAGDWNVNVEPPVSHDSRNSAYFFDRSGLKPKLSDLRYDKIHIVPFGEFLPFRQSLPGVFELIKKWGLGPPDMDNYQLNAGDENNLTVFPLIKTNNPQDLDTWRFVTPICFEDIDAGLTARMFRPGADGQKRADVLINLTNDGWFKANENSQHLQAATFRSIENRVPTARSVNTGISGFIDSVGRTHDLVPVRTSGVSTAKLSIDSRVTFYTRFGDVFGWICVSVTGSAWVLGMTRKRNLPATN